VIEALSSLGLETKDIEVYVFLAREGPHEAQSIANALRMYELELTNSLEILEKKGIIKTIDKITPEQFFAVSFEKVVDQLVEANLKTAEFTEKNKNIILRNWNSTLKKGIEDNSKYSSD
jgi:sugar-specific transcriptional regulator TrmB